jgi:hypothetical protein
MLQFCKGNAVMILWKQFFLQHSWKQFPANSEDMPIRLLLPDHWAYKPPLLYNFWSGLYTGTVYKW